VGDHPPAGGDLGGTGGCRALGPRRHEHASRRRSRSPRWASTSWRSTRSLRMSFAGSTGWWSSRRRWRSHDDLVGFALYQYLTVADPMDVRGTFTQPERLLGIPVMVLPVLYGMAIWTRGTRTHRVWFIAVVALGALTMLAGHPVLVPRAVLLVLSALKSLRALGYYLAARSLLVVIIVMCCTRTARRGLHGSGRSDRAGRGVQTRPGLRGRACS
jgi:hypothetical protein